MKKYRNAQPRILVTGFGPFPGTPFNASSTLVQNIPQEPSLRGIGVIFDAKFLPTAWREAPNIAEAWITELQPDAIIHFGVSSRATGFRIETRAYNEARRANDCMDCLPEGYYVKRGQAPVLHSTLPVELLTRSLRQAGVPVSLSHDAGRYLCNAVLYNSLLCAASLPYRPPTGFVHIPALPSPENADRINGRKWRETHLGLVVILRSLAAFVRAEKRLTSGANLTFAPHAPRAPHSKCQIQKLH